MTPVGSTLFRLSLLAFPREFRAAYGEEMITVFTERSSNRTTASIVYESFDALAAGTRMRLTHVRFRNSAALVTLAAAMIATTFALRDALDVRDAKPVGRIEFSAHDAAGFFTLTVIDGRPVAATMDNIPLPRNRIVSLADSVKLLTKDGRTAIALAFDPQRASISWSSRKSGDR
jgi:hypothetical protein